MKLNDQEKDDVRRFLLFLIDKKAEQSGGHNGFKAMDLQPFLDEMTNEGLIIKRETINSKSYFKK